MENTMINEIKNFVGDADEAYRLVLKLQTKKLKEWDIDELVKTIYDIECCTNCGEVLMFKIAGSKKWSRAGFFQCGGNKKRIYSWCSKKCYEEKNK